MIRFVVWKWSIPTKRPWGVMMMVDGKAHKLFKFATFELALANVRAGLERIAHAQR